MDTNKRNKNIVKVQLLLVLVIIGALLLVSSLTYDSGVIEEEAIFSLDPESDDYYKKKMDNPNVSFAADQSGEYADLIGEIFPNASITSVATWSDMLMRTAYGKDNAFLVDSVDKEWVVETSPTLYYFEEPVAIVEYALCGAKSDFVSEVITDFNEFLLEIDENGQRALWEEKWANAYDDYSIMPDEISFDENAKKIRVITELDWPPYVFYTGETGGSISGLYIEMFNYFCKEYGYVPEYTGSFSSDAAFLGMSSDTYDIFLYACVDSDERRESFLFTNTVSSAEMYLMTRVTEVQGIDVEEYVGGTSFFEYLQESLTKNLITDNRWQLLAKGLLTTILLSVCSIIVGTLLGLSVYYLYSRHNIFLSAIGHLYVNVFQRMPDVLLLLIICYIVFGGADIAGEIVCVISFSLSFASYVAEIFRSGVEAVPVGQNNAALALGFSKSQAFVKVILPQVIRIVLPVYKGQIVTLILETSIAGYIAVEDLTKMSDYIRALTFEALIPMLISALIYFLITLLFGVAITAIEKKLDPEHRRRLPKWVEDFQKEEKAI